MNLLVMEILVALRALLHRIRLTVSSILFISVM